MYCAKCGNELKVGEKFCPNCGARFGTTPNSMEWTISADGIKEKTKQVKSNILAGSADGGKTNLFLLANSVLMVLTMIFAMTPILKWDNSFFDMSDSVSLFINSGMLSTLFVICYIPSIIATYLPLLSAGKYKRVGCLPAKIFEILTVIWFLILLIVSIDEINSEGYGSWHMYMPVTGWLFVIALVGSLVLTFKLAYDFRKKQMVVNSTASEENRTTV